MHNPESTDRQIIFQLALPAVFQTVVKSSFSFIDAFWVGKLGSGYLAGLSVATFTLWGFISLSEMIPTGTASLIAQARGSLRYETAKKIGTINIVNTLFYSFLLGITVIPLLPVFYSIMGLNDAQTPYVSDYLIPLLIGLPCLTLLSTAMAVFRGYGDTKTPFYLLLLAIGLNFFLAPLLIFGFNLNGETYLRYENIGAALSTLIAYLISFFAGLYLLLKRNLINPIKLYEWSKQILSKTFSIGLPISLNGFAFSLIYVFLTYFVAQYGTDALAALGIGHRSESLPYQICVGFSLAATVLVGHSIGAQNPNRAEKLTWKILGLCSIIVGIYSIVLFVFSAEISSLFSSSANVISIASEYNRIAAIVLLFTAADVIFSGAFSGAGDSLPPALIGFPFNILRIPLAALLSPIYGITGIWIAIGITVVLKGILLAIWFKRGKWKSRKFSIDERKDHNLLELTNVE